MSLRDRWVNGPFSEKVREADRERSQNDVARFLEGVV